MTSPALGKHCDHAAVGVLISSPNGQFLVFERVRPPTGLAPVAGHLDQHGTPEQAARDEVREEVGLTVTHLDLLLEQWQPNPCPRTPTGPVGHQWQVFQAQVTGALRPSPREVRAPRWLHPDQLQRCALRTAAYAQGHLSDTEFTQTPGLEPVWCRFLHTLQIISLPPDILMQIGALL
ncbi:NUDIX hydrolase [Streptomyces sp. 4F14]|uniref:NUDIX hydrolase n=1 Tax=Streptomyces sp. 4F14 TaxID=3394380 RepID=UPI003A899DB5